MSKLNFKKCSAQAERIVKEYHSKQLPLEFVGHEQLATWVNDPTMRLQVKENVIHNDVVGEIVSKIKYFRHIDHADPILVVETIKGRFLVNGNHTATALEQIIRKAIVPGINQAPIAIIPNDMLPSDKEELRETLRLVATMMNRQPKVVRGMSKDDIRRMISEDIIDNIDVHDKEYQEAKANAAQMPLSTIREIIAKIQSQSETSLENKKFNFRQLTKYQTDKFKVSRAEKSRFVQVALVTKDQIFGSLAGVIQALVEHETCKNVHVIFHFKSHHDVETLKIPTINKMEKFKTFVNAPITYEFLDNIQYETHDGIDVSVRKYSKKKR